MPSISLDFVADVLFGVSFVCVGVLALIFPSSAFVSETKGGSWSAVFGGGERKTRDELGWETLRVDVVRVVVVLSVVASFAVESPPAALEGLVKGLRAIPAALVVVGLPYVVLTDPGHAGIRAVATRVIAVLGLGAFCIAMLIAAIGWFTLKFGGT